MINIILLLTIQYFNLNLTDCYLKDYNNTIFIILNDIYCHDCLKSMDIALKDVDTTYKIIILRKSQRKEQSVWANYRHFEKKYRFDEILFFNIPKSREITKLDLYDIKHTPALLIIKDNKENFIPYDLMFRFYYDNSSIIKEVRRVIE